MHVEMLQHHFLDTRLIGFILNDVWQIVLIALANIACRT